MSELITIAVFSDNKAGVLQRVTSAFTRRKINIESLTVSESEVPGIHRYTIIVNLTPTEAVQVTAAIEKQIDVQKAFWYRDNEIINREIAMYKMPVGSVEEGQAALEVVNDHGAKVIAKGEEFAVIQLTGRRPQTTALYEALEPLGMLEFSRSGMIAISKRMKVLHEYLLEVGEAAAH
jgi:acetolactate synthase-1/3 small subunit